MQFRINQNKPFMKLMLISILCLISTLTFAQMHTEQRKLTRFNSIEIKGSIDFTFQPSKEFSVQITGEYPEDIRTELNGNKLNIFHKKGKNWFSNEINTIGRGYAVVVHAPSLNQIISTGSGSISLEGVLKSDELHISLDGSGNLSGKINVGEFKLENAGSSNIRLSGNVENASIKSKGSGNFQCFDLFADNCTISKSGSGNAQISVNNSLTASISGTGNFTYKGSPKILASSSAGLGKIKKY
jgi:hypothetical protein